MNSPVNDDGNILGYRILHLDNSFDQFQFPSVGLQEFYLAGRIAGELETSCQAFVRIRDSTLVGATFGIEHVFNSHFAIF